MTHVSTFISHTALLPSVTLDRVSQSLLHSLHASDHPDALAIAAYLHSDDALAVVDARSVAFLQEASSTRHDARSGDLAAYAGYVRSWVNEILDARFPGAISDAAVS